ncbi:molybdenum cofactor biosysynthesis protein, partial [Curtobacterium sp. CT11-133]|uniref:molybdenum cofactor biosysynthesis protein n=2 Tax=unclassified Curtobacterium TaxID=257496 RepID=UPI0039AED526
MTDVDDVAGSGDLPYRTDVEIALLLVSRRHRYEGRPADGALPALDGEPDDLRERVELRAGLGIVGDRYFASRAHVHASVTVIGLEGLDAVAAELGAAVDPVATRRNVFLRGVDVEALRGQPFALDSGQGVVRFRGYRPANPCAWMDHEVAPGAFRAMRGRG